MEQWTLDVLRLTSLAERGHNQLARELCRDLGAVVAPDYVQAEVDGCGAARRGENVAAVDVQHVWVNLYARIFRRELLTLFPVRGRATSVEQPRGSEHKRSGAQRDDPRSALVRPPQLSHQDVGHGRPRGERQGDHDVRVAKRTEPDRSLNSQSTVGGDSATTGGADR